MFARNGTKVLRKTLICYCEERSNLISCSRYVIASCLAMTLDTKTLRKNFTLFLSRVPQILPERQTFHLQKVFLYRDGILKKQHSKPLDFHLFRKKYRC